MSLDVYLYDNWCPHCQRGTEVYSANITHNLNAMAEAAGIYGALWRPDENGFKTASQLIEPLQRGLAWLRDNPEEARKHDSPNRWDVYEDFVPWVECYLAACEANPEANVRVSR